MAMGIGNECFETHLIKEDGTLNGVELEKFLKKVNLAECGLNYAVVSIMGPQSSGKSTLVNHLFGSKFKELDGLQKREKTTKGIWLARCADIDPCTLVMDVEGSDGKERKDDTSFERRSGLFALAVSHMVLINMFYTSVGLENAASRPLLENVLQGVLRLFSPRKTTLMFVVRDLVQMTQLDLFKDILMKDIKKIWDSIPKPERHKTTPLSNFFKIEVEGLPNFMEKKEQFKEQVEILRQRFNNSIAPDGLAGDRRDTIPGSDFSLSAQLIWKTIKEDRELDLPKNTVMIANIRCEEIVAEMLKTFDENEERRKLEKNALTNGARDFREKYSSIIESCMDGYDKKTEYYDEDVRSEKRKHLKEKLMLVVQSAIQPILANIGSRSLKEFYKAFHNALEEVKDAKKAAQNCKEACLKSFDDGCADVIVEQANCNTKEQREKLELEIKINVLQAERILEEKKRNVKAFAEGMGVGVTAGLAATGVIGGAIGLIDAGNIALPATGVARSIAAGANVVGSLVALARESVEAYEAYKSENKISRIELEATEPEGN